MTRLLALIAASATLAAAPVLAEQHAMSSENPEEYTMLEQKLRTALDDCNLNDVTIDSLTMAQAAGITIAASSDDASQQCNSIESIARGDG